jgi:hypothetical protein
MGTIWVESEKEDGFGLVSLVELVWNGMEWKDNYTGEKAVTAKLCV